MVDVQETLRKIGLTNNEISVYLTLLRMGPSIVSDVAKSAGLYRPYTYDNLKKLLEKGLVSFIVKDGKNVFSAVEPENLVDVQKNRLEEVKSILPELNRLSSSVKNEAKAEFYLGSQVVRVVVGDVFRTLKRKGGEALIIGVDEKKFMEADELSMYRYFEDMKKNKLKEKVLVREGDNYLPAPRSTTSYRFLSKEFFEPTSTMIYGNKVAIVIFSQPLHGIIIENEALAKTYRKQFNALWKIAKV
ncbi:MAG: helix-turn-helix domain-containing protein [Nanoarchaeota archaeon]|nr:helix-turn-helix domain-containing protein [Nanoarchaeota archaeon]